MRKEREACHPSKFLGPPGTCYSLGCSECHYFQTEILDTDGWIILILDPNGWISLNHPLLCLPSPAHPAGFSFCNFTGFLVIFNVVTSSNGNNGWIIPILDVYAYFDHFHLGYISHGWIIPILDTHGWIIPTLDTDGLIIPISWLDYSHPGKTTRNIALTSSISKAAITRLGNFGSERAPSCAIDEVPYTQRNLLEISSNQTEIANVIYRSYPLLSDGCAHDCYTSS